MRCTQNFFGIDAVKAALVRSLRNLLAADSSSMLLTGDLGFGALDQLQVEFPEQFLNVGICEQSMMSVAAGIASTGRCCFVYSIANFPSLRCLEQIRNDVALHGFPVVIISNGAGFAYGYSGYSHHGLEDLAAVRAMPGIRVATPCDERELEEVLDKAASELVPTYVRLGSLPPQTLGDLGAVYERGVTFRGAPHPQISIVGTGFGGYLAFQVAATLEEDRSLKVTCFSSPYCDEISAALLQQWSDCELLVTIEEHALVGGFGSAVWEQCCALGLKPNILPIGLSGEYRTQTGSSNYLREFHGLDPRAITRRIDDTLWPD
jgi:transketolase